MVQVEIKSVVLHVSENPDSPRENCNIARMNGVSLLKLNAKPTSTITANCVVNPQIVSA